MNRLIINIAEPGMCSVCAGERKLRVDAADYKIVGIVECPACWDPSQLDSFVGPLMDYLTRPGTPRPEVIA